MNTFYLIIHILFAIGMFLSLKIVNSKNINKYQAITINYIVALILTSISYGESPFASISVMSRELIYSSLLVGFLFIFSFVLMSFSTVKAGIGITTALNKMAVVIPVMVGILYLGQNEWLVVKIIGIVLALISFALVLFKGNNEKVNIKSLYLPVSVFIVSGLIDTSMEIVNKKYISIENPQELFLMGIFATASIIGVLTIIFDMSKKIKGSRFTWEPLIWGSIMGVFNFLVSKMILVNVGLMGGSVVFPVHNASVVMLTALAGVLFFKERFSLRQWIGVAVAIVSVVLIATTI